MTRQERAFELRKRGYSATEIANIVGWDATTALRFFSDPEIKALLESEKTKVLNLEDEDEFTARKELDTLDDRLARVEHNALDRLQETIKTADINDARRVLEVVGKRRTELSKQTGSHEGDKLGAGGKVVSIFINSTVAERLTRNSQNQITEVKGRELKTLDREKIKALTSQPIEGTLVTKVDALDEIESTL